MESEEENGRAFIWFVLLRSVTALSLLTLSPRKRIMSGDHEGAPAFPHDCKKGMLGLSGRWLWLWYPSCAAHLSRRS